MKKTTVALAALAVLFAGCGGDTEPADPPTSQDALTTTSDAEPTTQAPPDDVEETSSTPDDVAETTEAGGPPTMPDEAKEDSEAGAEAFALHYIDIINYTSKYPEVGLLEPLGADSCEACKNHEVAVENGTESGHVLTMNIFDVASSVALHNPSKSVANVRVEVAQIGQDVVDSSGAVVERVEDANATLAFNLVWDEGWQIEALRAEVQQ